MPLKTFNMKKVFVVLCCAGLAVSCKKDGDNNSQTKTDLLVSSAWKYQSAGASIDGNSNTIEYSAEDLGIALPCVTDNTGTFNANGSGINDEGPTKCDPAVPQSTPFSWNFSNNETVLNISGAGFVGLSGAFNIAKLDATSMRLTKDTTVPSVPFPITFVLNLQH